MAYSLVPWAPQHADQVAAIHIIGQEGTFLTELGAVFLRALYAQMATSPLCYGYVAIDGEEVIGVVVGTVDSAGVFKELILRRGLRLVWPVFIAMIRQPRLIAQVFETLRYPDQHVLVEGEAELFFIGVRPERRREGVGVALFDALAGESARRGMGAMGLTVDADNQDAQRFYRDRGMASRGSFTLYGRAMHWFRLPLDGGEA